jgi:hypothetical protein
MALACATYLVNVWLFSSQTSIRLSTSMSPLDASLFEGLIFVLFGVLFLIGSGGITQASRKAALLAAAASAMGNDVIGPSEVYRRDAWRPKGYAGFGLILIMTGVILLVIYFVLA